MQLTYRVYYYHGEVICDNVKAINLFSILPAGCKIMAKVDILKKMDKSFLDKACYQAPNGRKIIIEPNN